MNNFE
jgi:predicted Fe-S protein YdhL (DUF1289 family)